MGDLLVLIGLSTQVGDGFAEFLPVADLTLDELCAQAGEGVVLARWAVLGFLPERGDHALSLQPPQQRVEGALGGAERLPLRQLGCQFVPIAGLLADETGEYEFVLQTPNAARLWLNNEDEPLIVKTKQFAIGPMSPSDAVLQLELIGHDFFVFRNDETNEINVVYRRRDGNYGLIEPQ